MSTSNAAVSATPEAQLLTRVLDEGYGPAAWHGPDLKAALADVSVRGQLSGMAPEAFVLEGEDWFELSGPARLSWSQIQAAVDKEQSKLAAVVADIAAGRVQSKLSEAARFSLVLGITCHAVYHAGQIQLLKRLHGA